MTTTLEAGGVRSAFTADLSWHDKAACRNRPEPFFKDHGGAAIEARHLCFRCPVQAICLNDAMTTESGLAKEHRGGVWGGLTPGQRWERDRVRVIAPSPEATKPARSGGRQLAPCGTQAAVERHNRRGEELDEACQEFRDARTANRRGGPAAPCGTKAAYQRHKNKGEDVDEACLQWRKENPPGKRPAKCGTASGYQRHVNRREQPCQPCRDAKAVDARAARERKKAKDQTA